jgi:ABC-2 type transport system ATP-binding protein
LSGGAVSDFAQRVARRGPLTLLALRDITKRWHRSPRPVLDGASIVVEPGTVVGISGRNGAGKTTLLRIAAGLIAAESGAVELDGLSPDHNRRAFQRQIGFVSAGNGSLYARLTVDNHLDLMARMALLPASELSQARSRSISAFQLNELRDRRVDRLSSGQRQRLRLALGFVHGPAVALLDEPETSLDAEGAELLALNVARHRERGGAAIVCTPSGTLQHIEVDRRCELVDGRIVER